MVETDRATPPPHQREPYRFKLSHLPIYIILTVGCLLMLTPFLWMISTSLMSLGETINRQLLPHAPRFGNYAEAWSDASFDKYFLNSVIISAVTIAGLLTTTVLAGYAFARIKFFGKNIIFVILLSTLMIPETITLIPNFLLIRGSIIPWDSWINTLRALTIPFFGQAFSIFLVRQFFAQIPDDLWDAARIDGAGHLRFLVSVVVPMSRPVIMTVILLTFISSWNSFLWPLLVTTTAKWRPLMVGLYSFVTEAGPQTQLLMAGAVITIIPILVIYFIAQKQFTEGIATTGLKG